MLKSTYIDVFFETENDRSAFDCWFESNDWTGYTPENAIEKIDNFFEYDQYDEDFCYDEEDEDLYPIEDYSFGKNGNEAEYIESVREYIAKVNAPVLIETE